MIYFIGQFMDNVLFAVKIGHAKVVTKRLRDMQVGSAGDLRVLCQVEGGKEQERELHERFRGSHMRGEWYRPGEDLLAFIREHEGDSWGRGSKEGIRVTVDLSREDYARLVDLSHSMGEPKARVMRRLLWFYGQMRDLREELSAEGGVQPREVGVGLVVGGRVHVLELPEDEFGHPLEQAEEMVWPIKSERYSDVVETGAFLAWESETVQHQVEEIRVRTGLQNRSSVIRFAIRYLRALLTQQRQGEKLGWVKGQKARRAWLPNPVDVRVQEDGPEVALDVDGEYMLLTQLNQPVKLRKIPSGRKG